MPKKYTEEQQEELKQRNRQHALVSRKNKKEKLSKMTQECDELHKKCLDLKKIKKIHLEIPKPPSSTAAAYFQKVTHVHTTDKKRRHRREVALHRLRLTALSELGNLYIKLCNKLSNDIGTAPEETLLNEIKKYTELCDQCINGNTLKTTSSKTINTDIKSYREHFEDTTTNTSQPSSSSTTDTNVKNRYAHYSIPTKKSEESSKELSNGTVEEYDAQELTAEDEEIKKVLNNTFGIIPERITDELLQESYAPDWENSELFNQNYQPIQDNHNLFKDFFSMESVENSISTQYLEQLEIQVQQPPILQRLIGHCANEQSVKLHYEPLLHEMMNIPNTDIDQGTQDTIDTLPHIQFSPLWAYSPNENSSEPTAVKSKVPLRY